MKKIKFLTFIALAFVSSMILFTSAKAPATSSPYTPKDIFRDVSEADQEKIARSKNYTAQSKYKLAIDALQPLDSDALIYQAVFMTTEHYQSFDQNGIIYLNSDENLDAANGEEADLVSLDLRKIMDDYVAANGETPLINLSYAKYWTALMVETALSGDTDTTKLAKYIQEADKNYIAAMLREYYTKDTFLDWAYIITSDYLGTGDYEKAIQILKWGVMIYPTAEFNYHLARTYYSIENYEEAVEPAKKALDLSKKDKTVDEDTRMELYYIHGYSCRMTDRIEEARKTWAQAAKDFKNDTMVVYNQGLLELSQKNWSQAAKFFVKAYNLDQQDLSSVMQVIYLYMGGGVFPQGENHYDQAILLTDQLAKATKDKANKVIIKYYKVQLYMLDGQFDAALPLLDEVEREFIALGDDPEVTHQYIETLREMCRNPESFQQ